MKMIRLIVDSYHMGSWNMASDMAITNYVASGRAPVTIKLYGWTVPTLSIGKKNNVEVFDLEYIKNNGIELIRRPTDGRPFFHTKGFSFLFAAPSEYMINREKTNNEFSFVENAIVESIKELGIDSGNLKRKTKNILSYLFNENILNDEICLFNKSFISSVILKTERFYMVQGYVPFEFDIRNYINCFNINNKKETIKELSDEFTGIYNYKNIPLGFDDIAYSLKIGFKKVFNEEVVMNKCTETETEITKEYYPMYIPLI